MSLASALASVGRPLALVLARLAGGASGVGLARGAIAARVTSTWARASSAGRPPARTLAMCTRPASSFAASASATPLRAVKRAPAPLAGSAFVSAHYRLGPNDVSDYLAGKGLELRVTETEVNVKECPFCRGARGKPDNQWKLYFSRANGTYFCHRCGAQGNYFQFKSKMGDLRLASQIRSGADAAGGSADALADGSHESAAAGGGAADGASKRPRPPAGLATQQAAMLFTQPKVLAYLSSVDNGGRGLSEATLRHYGVGLAKYAFPASLTASSTAAATTTTTAAAAAAAAAAGAGAPVAGSDATSAAAAVAAPAVSEWIDHACVTFPWMERGADGTLNTVRIKARSLRVKSAQRLEPRGGGWGLFGWHTVPDDAREIIITEGEYDAMAVYEATKRPAVSLPNGARSLPTELLPMLERFERVYLWMDDDVAGQEGCAKIAKKLGEARCLLVHAREGKSTGPKDANDALRAGLDLNALLAAAHPIQHEQIVSFRQLRDEVLREITNPLQAAGVQSRTLPGLNRLLKGHRPGELTIVSGPTGSGKTSFLSQLSLDYAAQGVPTLWGSFEINNVRLIKKMLQQYAAKTVSTAAEFDAWADRFESLPLYFLRFFGSTQIAEVLDAMEYASYANDVTHVVLDNLQFMSSGQGKGFERFEILDRSIEMLRKFATEKGVHISLVVHPRKVDDEQLLSTASVFGTAKATQEADNIVLLQRGEGGKQFLDIRKNRFDGELGIVPYRFDRTSGNIFEVSASGAPVDPGAVSLPVLPPAPRARARKPTSQS